MTHVKGKPCGRCSTIQRPRANTSTIGLHQQIDLVTRLSYWPGRARTLPIQEEMAGVMIDVEEDGTGHDAEMTRPGKAGVGSRGSDDRFGPGSSNFNSARGDQRQGFSGAFVEILPGKDVVSATSANWPTIMFPAWAMCAAWAT